jgi:hypothetical protein
MDCEVEQLAARRAHIRQLTDARSSPPITSERDKRISIIEISNLINPMSSAKMRISIIVVVCSIIGSCIRKQDKNQKEPNQNEPQGIIELDVRLCEKLIPNSLFDTNHIVIWREGSIYFSEYISCLIIEDKQLNDNQILCHYMTFESQKPSNYRNWKYANIYELTLENIPFKYPLKSRVGFNVIDSLCFECQCEGIEANVYFLKQIDSDWVYPVHRKYNRNQVRNIEYLFKQISKKEHAQTLSLIRDSVDYKEVGGIMCRDEMEYCIKDNYEAGSIQRRWGDK